MTELEKARREIDEADRLMAEQFERRMNAVRTIALYKKENGLPIDDPAREKAMIEKNAGLIKDTELREYYVRFLKDSIEVSKAMQRSLLDGTETLSGRASGRRITVKTSGGGYDVHILRGGIDKAGELFDLSRKVLIVTDDGVPVSYAQRVASQCGDPTVVTLPQGERTKNGDSFLKLLSVLCEKEFTRTDCVVAVGGGVVGDLAGFAAACYMRGIDFYNIPTTVLSQVDSSVGGKTGIDLAGYKNIVGAFWQPRGVVIDPDVLATLPQRQVSNGLAEALKISLTSDPELFAMFERGKYRDDIDAVIERAVRIKASVVERDEKENSLRRVLNFGHTLAHAIETVTGFSEYYHGECVALGMLPMCSGKVRARLLPVLSELKLPTKIKADPEKLVSAIRHDKKAGGDGITVVFVPETGSFELKKIPFSELESIVKGAVEK